MNGKSRGKARPIEARRVRSVFQRFAFALLGGILMATAQAANYTAQIEYIEVWPSGNIAFKVVGVTGVCNGQFIINQSMPGAKNLYAALLTAKASGNTITVAQTSCGAADGYGGNYAVVDYLYYY